MKNFKIMVLLLILFVSMGGGWAYIRQFDKTWVLVYYSGASPTHIGHDAFQSYGACADVKVSAKTAAPGMIDDTNYQCVPVWYRRIH